MDTWMWVDVGRSRLKPFRWQWNIHVSEQSASWRRVPENGGVEGKIRMTAEQSGT